MSKKVGTLKVYRMILRKNGGIVTFWKQSMRKAPRKAAAFAERSAPAYSSLQVHFFGSCSQEDLHFHLVGLPTRKYIIIMIKSRLSLEK